MDEDRIKGSAAEFGGKVKDAVGGLTGDDKTQVEGKIDQLSGKLQNAVGSAKDTVRESAGGAAEQIEEFVKAQPIVALLSAVGVGFLLAWMISRD